jgi:Peptidase A4 family
MRRRLCAAATVLAMGGVAWGGLAAGSVASARMQASSAGIRASISNPGGPVIRAPGGNSGLPTISLNWSGYAATARHKRFTAVNSQFIEPAITCVGVRDQFTSEWVGLDGFTDATVEQDGTAAWCGGPDGTVPHYEAWYELFPAASVSVFRVAPGDTIRASVRYTHRKFLLTISDLTSGKSVRHTAKCKACKRSSAEWIIERPALCNKKQTKCFLTELADFGKTTMSEDRAALNGRASRSARRFANIPVFMVSPITKGFISLDTVGPLISGGRAFTATWDRSGKITPLKL